MQAIAIADNNWAVSYHDKPYASIPAEKKTMMDAIKGKTILYDLPYLPELPGLQPIPGCRNLIYTKETAETVKGAECFKSLDAMKKALKEDTEDVFIIHGAALYAYFYDMIDTFHITKIDYAYRADAYMPDLDKDPAFTITADSDEQYCYDIIYSFLKYERRK